MKKRIINLLIALIASVTIYAQAPNSFKYQAVVRDASSNIIANKNVSFRLSVYKTSITGAVVYSETHSVMTNNYGLANMNIGSGVLVSGSFSTIDWGNDSYFIKTELDAAGGSSYSDMGVSQLQSVPYALNAKSVSGMTMNDLIDVTVSGATVNQVLSWDGSSWVPVTSSAGTTYSAGSGILLSGTTFSNSAPDQTVSFTQSGATTVSGTYPNFTISSTDNNTTYGAGSGMGLSGTTFSNTAPDQTVTLSPSGATTISGSYPNFTISSTDNNTTYSAGTGMGLSGTTFSAQTSTALWNANKLQGRAVATTIPATNQVLGWNGSQWTPQTVTGGPSYIAGTGVSLSGTTFSAQTSTALWNANKLQGRAVATTAPSTNQVLGWNGSQWTPQTVSGGTSPWTTSGSNIYRNTGKVGIGLINPTAQIHVKGTLNGANNILGIVDALSGSTTLATAAFSGRMNGASTVSNNGVEGVSSGSTGRNVGVLGIGKNGATGNSVIGVAGSTDNSAVGRYNMSFFCTANGAGDNNSLSENNGIFGTAAGNLKSNYGGYFQALGYTGTTNTGIYASAGNSTTNYAGYFNGNVAYTGTLTSVSDKRLKTNITPYTGALNRLMQLDIYRYNYSATGAYSNLNLASEKQYGFLAQDLETLFPDLVHNNKVPNKKTLNENGTFDVVEGGAEYKSVNQIGMIPILTRAMQEQQELINNQQLLIEKQNQLIEGLDKRIIELEK
jgi:hypothetical protein